MTGIISDVSLNVTISLVAADDGSGDLSRALAQALESAGVRPQDRGSSGVIRRTGEPDTVEIFATVVADDEQAVTAAVVDALIEQGVNVIDSASHATLVEPEVLSAQGAQYDIATGTLTIETSESEWGDLSIKLLGDGGSITGLMASNKRGRRVEDGLRGLFHIIIRRGGGFTEV